MSTPVSVQGVVGIQRTLGAPSPQTQGTTTYTFASWSDGGAATHTISTPAANTTYTATFQAATGPPGLGLLGTYYNNQNFTGTQVTRLDPTVNFDWGSGIPDRGDRPRHLQRAVAGPGAGQGLGDPHVLHHQRRRGPPVDQQPAHHRQLHGPRPDREHRDHRLDRGAAIRRAHGPLRERGRSGGPSVVVRARAGHARSSRRASSIRRGPSVPAPSSPAAARARGRAPARARSRRSASRRRARW